MTRGKTIVSKIVPRVPIYFSALMALALMLGAGGSAQAKFKASQVASDYGCISSTEGLVTQMIQFHTDKKGKVETGSLIRATEGEDCNYSLASGSYTIDPDTGFGTLTLNWTFSAGADGDEAFCSTIFPGASFTHHFAFILESSGKRLDLATLDPGLTGPAITGSDSGDFARFGSCIMQ